MSDLYICQFVISLTWLLPMMTDCYLLSVATVAVSGCCCCGFFIVAAIHVAIAMAVTVGAMLLLLWTQSNTTRGCPRPQKNKILQQTSMQPQTPGFPHASNTATCSDNMIMKIHSRTGGSYE